MEFSTYIIEPNRDKTVNYGSLIALIGMFSLIIICAFGWYTIAAWWFGILVVLILILAFIKKGKLQGSVLSKNKLVITADTISIAGKEYDIKTIRNLEFLVHSFSGMDYHKGGQFTSDGMDNYIRFTVNDEKISCNFYLNSRKHAFILCQVFEEFYKNKTPFIEKDMNNKQTYLFKWLEGKELDAFKQKYGYTTPGF